MDSDRENFNLVLDVVREGVKQGFSEECLRFRLDSFFYSHYIEGNKGVFNRSHYNALVGPKIERLMEFYTEAKRINNQYNDLQKRNLFLGPLNHWMKNLEINRIEDRFFMN